VRGICTRYLSGRNRWPGKGDLSESGNSCAWPVGASAGSLIAGSSGSRELSCTDLVSFRWRCFKRMTHKIPAAVTARTLTPTTIPAIFDCPSLLAQCLFCFRNLTPLIQDPTLRMPRISSQLRYNSSQVEVSVWLHHQLFCNTNVSALVVIAIYENIYSPPIVSLIASARGQIRCPKSISPCRNKLQLLAFK
jgi:hypothetical protein